MGQAETKIVIGCSSRRRAALGVVVEVLGSRGFAVEVASGIEATTQTWSDAVKRAGPTGVFLVCQDEALSDVKRQTLESIALQASVPRHRVWSGLVDWNRPMALVEQAQALTNASPMPIGMFEAGMSTPREIPIPGDGALPSETILSTQDQPRETNASWKLAAAGAALLVGIGAVTLGVARSRAAQQAGDEPDSSESAAVAVLAPESEEPELAQPEVELESDADAEAKADADAVDDPSPVDDGDDPANDTAQTEPEVDELTEITVAADQDQAIVSALGGQKIRALDILLISPEAQVPKGRRMRASKLKFDDAKMHCEHLVVEGIDGWRLPSIGELNSLTQANMLQRGAVYWSSTKGDTFGNKRVVWNVTRWRMASVPNRWRGARTVCVREQA